MPNLKYLRPLILNWAEKYVAGAYKKEMPGSLMGAHHERLEDQLRFISIYAMRMQGQNEISQEIRVSQFLTNQLSENWEKGLMIGLTDSFWEICIFSPEIAEIDFQVAIRLTGCERIYILRKDCTRWTDKRVVKARFEIEEDLSFDGEEVSFDIQTTNDLEITNICIDGSKQTGSSLGFYDGYLEAILLHLARSSDYRVRFLVAGMKSITKSVVAILGKDARTDIRLRLLSNLAAHAFLSKKRFNEILQSTTKSRGKIDWSKPIIEGFMNIFKPKYEYYEELEEKKLRHKARLRFDDSREVQLLFSRLKRVFDTEAYSYEEIDLSYWLDEKILCMHEWYKDSQQS